MAMEIITDIYKYEPVPCAATVGSFDGLHVGHCAMLGELKRAAAERGLPLMVVTFARHPRLLFDGDCEPFLLATNSEKTALLAAAGVDICVMLDFDSCMASMSAWRFMSEVLYARLGVELLAVGYDHRFGTPAPCEGLREYVSYGSRLGIEVLPTAPFYLNGVECSSSVVRRALSAGDIEAANAVLGYRYSFAGQVVHGAAIGRGLGFPTANVMPDEPLKLLPADGVYEVAVSLMDKAYKGVMNIGVKPTVGENLMRTVEVHLLGFSGNIYGRELRVELVRRIRGEMEFDNLDALRAQIEADVASVCK